MQLTLASTSVFRKMLLEKLCIPFDCVRPEVDETALPDESAEQLVRRLAIAKARAVAKQKSAGWIIGSDQVAVSGERILGKPHTHENAVNQLAALSGQTVQFLTGLCLYNGATDQYQAIVEPFEVEFKSLTDQQIEHYLRLEQPYQCAGSFKSEGLGISLFNALKGDDPNSLIGLPLIRLIALFADQQIDLLDIAWQANKSA